MPGRAVPAPRGREATRRHRPARPGSNGSSETVEIPNADGRTSNGSSKVGFGRTEDLPSAQTGRLPARSEWIATHLGDQSKEMSGKAMFGNGQNVREELRDWRPSVAGRAGSGDPRP